MNSHRFKLIILVLAVAGMFLGCSEDVENQRPKNLIPEDTYIDLMIELQLLESYRTSIPKDSLKVNIDSLKNVIYDKYKVEEQQFLASHQYYQRQVKPQADRISNAIDSLKQQMVKDGLMDSTRLGE